MRTALLIIVACLCIGCRPTDIEPPQAVSFYYRNDGTRRIPPTAIPKTTTKISDPSLLTDQVSFSTTPVTLPEAKGFVIGTQQGEIMIFGDTDSLLHRAKLSGSSAVFRLAANHDVIIALQNSGALTAMGHDGKVRWQTTDSLTRSDINLAGNDLLVIADQGIRCYDVSSGKEKFHIVCGPSPIASAFDGKKFYVALSWGSATGSDSVYGIAPDGKIESRLGFKALRITSNIALTGEDHSTLVFGAQGELDAGGIRRRTFIVGYDLREDAKQILRQELEYIPTNVSSATDIVLASGFVMSGADYAGAIDAFLAGKNEKIWQRRFTEPLATPVAVTTQHAFFSLSFESKADIPSSGILYALELTTGISAREVTIGDARNGFVPGLPVPYKGGFLLADAITSIIYRLSPE